MFERLGHLGPQSQERCRRAWLAARDPRVPWYAKVVAGMVAAYALSPIDLIPDFVPVLGYADDLLIVPLGILLAIRLILSELLEEHRRTARTLAERPVSRTAAIVIASLRIVGAALLVAWLFRIFEQSCFLDPDQSRLHRRRERQRHLARGSSHILWGRLEAQLLDQANTC